MKSINPGFKNIAELAARKGSKFVPPKKGKKKPLFGGMKHGNS